MISKYKLVLFLFIVFISCKKETNKPVVNISPHLLDSLKYAEVQAKEDSLRSTLYYFKYTEKLPKSTKLDSIVFFQRKIVMGYEVIDSIITYKNGKAFQNVIENENINDLLSIDRFQNPMQHLNADNNKDIILKWAFSGTIGTENIIFLFNRINNHFEKLNLPDDDLCCLSVNLIYNKKKNFYISRNKSRGDHFVFFKFIIKNNKVKILETLRPVDYDSIGIQYDYKIENEIIKYRCINSSANDNFDCDPQLTKLLKKFWKEYGVDEY